MPGAGVFLRVVVLLVAAGLLAVVLDAAVFAGRDLGLAVLLPAVFLAAGLRTVFFGVGSDIIQLLL